VFCSYYNRHSGDEFAFSACNAQTAINRFVEYLINCCDIMYKIAFDQEIHFTANGAQQCMHDHKTHWFSHVSHHPKESGLIECWVTF
jgi:hypothetical protein